MTTHDLVSYMLDRSEFAGDPERAGVYTEVAARLAGLDAECARLRGVVESVRRDMVVTPVHSREDVRLGLVRALHDAL